ncbi:hypothetical protein EOD04_15470 [Mesorhizobium sp. M2C.T.Ca.TU.009.01.2.1]|nr:hypothetical protein EOD07_31060 [Mesorhizobium sp. M2C.T.Ca.TU.002.02.1.1]RUU67884.1 hypothetical protein EOD04_15470 [Mesorhizobium sp. M2C.T.Ca.TU.009.01.2.1]
MLWMGDRLNTDQGEQLREIWSTRGRKAFIAEKAKAVASLARADEHASDVRTLYIATPPATMPAAEAA